MMLIKDKSRENVIQDFICFEFYTIYYGVDKNDKCENSQFKATKRLKIKRIHIHMSINKNNYNMA